MAGQGWREWVAGEQLTDEKMQNFLMDQAVMRFDDASARTTALNGVVSEGMVSYLNDTNKVEYYDGSAWEELTGDPDIFTQGTAGQYLQSNGTAGVEWAAIDSASPTVEGLVFALTQDFALSNSERNLSLGKGSGGTAITGSLIGNTCLGHNAAGALTTGRANTIVGNQVGRQLTTGVGNVLVGASAGDLLTTGTNNAFVGVGAGASSAGTASNNTAIGHDAGFNGGVTYTGSNVMLLGKGANPSGTAVSNEITLGNSSITALRCEVSTISALSDKRDKIDIEPLNYGLAFLNELNPVEFTWNMRDGAKVGVKDIGFIAQDLAELEDEHDPERLRLTLRSNPDKMEATPGRLIPILVKAIQELAAEIEDLKNART
jgi:hypothetical protein